MTPNTPASNPAAEWQNARALYPLYAALAREFVIDTPPCAELQNGIDAPSPQSIEQARNWLLGVDGHIQVHQLRQFLQTTSLSNESALRELLIHHLAKPVRDDSDRDKTDFLLVQLFSNCAPSHLDDSEVSLKFVAQLLQPILKSSDLTIPEWLKPLEGLIQEANRCQTLNKLFTSRIIEKGRAIKTSAGDNFFQPVAMAAFTRFSFLMRRVFFRLMQQDLNAILDGLRLLEQNNVAAIDCRKAQFSAEEPVARLRMICQSWKVMFQAEYSSGQALAMLVDLRTAVDAALAKASIANPALGRVSATTATSSAPQAKAAVAGASAAPEIAEFEISTTDWDPDAATN